MSEANLNARMDMHGFHELAAYFFAQTNLASSAPVFLNQLKNIFGVGHSLLLLNEGAQTLTVFDDTSVTQIPPDDLLDDLSLMFPLPGCFRIASARRLSVLNALGYRAAEQVSDLVYFSIDGISRSYFFVLLKLGNGDLFDDREFSAFEDLAAFLERISAQALISRDGETLSERLREQHRRESIWLESLAWLNEMGATTVKINEQADFYKAALFQLKLLVSADMALAIQYQVPDDNLQVIDSHGEVEGIKSLIADFSALQFAQNSEKRLQIRWTAAEYPSIANFGLSEILIHVFHQGDQSKILFVIGRIGKAYDSHEEKVASLFADNVANIVEREHLLEEIRIKNKKLAREQAEQKKLIKQLSEAQAQLLQQEKMASIGQLAAGVAHEINNPVGYVNSNISALERYIDDIFGLLALYSQLESSANIETTAAAAIATLKKSIDFDCIQDDVHDLIQESKEGVLRVKQIVKDLKDFSHIGESEWQMADVISGIKSTLNIVHNELKYKATVEDDYDALPLVECVPSQINQVIMNLLVNSSHSIEEHGTITVRTRKLDEQHVYIEVEDTGKGISEENMTKIFNPFFTTKPVGKGTGLGLSLSYSIIEKHKGSITVRSTIGKGTCFRITLPIRQGECKVHS